jgi:IS5 family transposase
MMKQQTLTGFERYAKTTRRAQFLADMQVIVPWADLVAVVEPFYPKVSEGGGRPPSQCATSPVSIWASKRRRQTSRSTSNP